MGRRKRESLGRFDDLQEFVRQAKNIDRMEGLHALMSDLVNALGFSYFALFDHVAGASKRVVRLHNYRPEWQETVVKRKYFTIDPVHWISQRSAAGFHWAEFPRFLSLSDKQREFMDEARRAEIANGFTVPMNIPGEYPASISFAVRAGMEFPHESLPVANYLAPLAFEAARRLCRGPARGEGRAKTGLRLTARQLDCILLVAQGKSDTDIAAILGLSPATVRFHVDNARERLNVATRTQLVVGALYASQLTFADILPGQPAIRPPSQSR
jgi:LuxR family quorum-sensing system transcriptional regulator CciR